MNKRTDGGIDGRTDGLLKGRMVGRMDVYPAYVFRSVVTPASCISRVDNNTADGIGNLCAPTLHSLPICVSDEISTTHTSMHNSQRNLQFVFERNKTRRLKTSDNVSLSINFRQTTTTTTVKQLMDPGQVL